MFDNPMLNAVMSSLGALLRSFGYNDEYLGGILQSIATDINGITGFVSNLAIENEKRQQRVETKLDAILEYVNGRTITLDPDGTLHHETKENRELRLIREYEPDRQSQYKSD